MITPFSPLSCKANKGITYSHIKTLLIFLWTKCSLWLVDEIRLDPLVFLLNVHNNLTLMQSSLNVRAIWCVVYLYFCLVRNLWYPNIWFKYEIKLLLIFFLWFFPSLSLPNNLFQTLSYSPSVSLSLSHSVSLSLLFFSSAFRKIT